MEGPFISEAKKGAQDARNIIRCDAEVCRRFLEASEGLVKFVGIAPECNPEAVDFIREMKGDVQISLAHTNADYDSAMAAFQAGASHAVHLYNAMPPFTHRAPGVVGAVADNPQVDAEIICDGVHIHPAAVRATFQMLGADRMILISDSMRATGMPDGTVYPGRSGCGGCREPGHAGLRWSPGRFCDKSDRLYADRSERNADPAGDCSGLRNHESGEKPGDL